jgi:hypothetical protein
MGSITEAKLENFGRNKGQKEQGLNRESEARKFRKKQRLRKTWLNGGSKAKTFRKKRTIEAQPEKQKLKRFRRNEHPKKNEGCPSCEGTKNRHKGRQKAAGTT